MVLSTLRIRAISQSQGWRAQVHLGLWIYSMARGDELLRVVTMDRHASIRSSFTLDVWAGTGTALVSITGGWGHWPVMSVWRAIISQSTIS